jgi:DNA-directed RNA polymerase specialized sigma subunit
MLPVDNYAAEFQRLSALIQQHEDEKSAASMERARLVADMLQTRTQAQAAAELGISPGRVAQLLTRVRDNT